MEDRGEERRLAAIVVLDVVGFSRLMGDDETGTLGALNRHRRLFVDPTVAAHRGRQVKATGDGLLLEFSSVVDAVRCAVAIQQGMHSRTVGEEDDRRIVFRIGVNIGDIIIQGQDIFGDGVNVAARLEALSEPGGICISRSAHEQIRTVFDIAFVDLGDHTVKNIARPVGVYALPTAFIAAMPPAMPSLLAVPRGWRRRSTLSAFVVALLVVGVVAIVAWRRVPTPVDDRPSPRDIPLVAALPTGTEASRAKLAAAYAALPMHRGFVLAPRGGSHMSSGDWSTRAEAEDRNLERCQSAFAEPCAVVAVDDVLMAKTGVGVQGERLPVRDMPRTHYAGGFDPYWIPGVRSSVVKKADVAGYRAIGGPKAVAYHLRGLVYVVTGTATQRDAEITVLATCNAAPALKDATGPCLLYAVGNQVVMPERLTGPRTAR